MKEIAIVFGTRPELIKLSPIIRELKLRKLDHRFRIICTNQHPDMIGTLYEQFDIEVDTTIEIDNKNKPFGVFINELTHALYSYFTERMGYIEYVVGHGDTSSCFAAAQAAFQANIPFAHVEAGLRSYNLEQPFPEEIFRQLIGSTASIHFSPTLRATENLISEGVPVSKIIQTGNTIVDVIKNWMAMNPTRLDQDRPNKVLITCHRRENQNDQFNNLIETVLQLAREHQELDFVWLSHSNPFVKEHLEILESSVISNVEVRAPLSIYEMFEFYRSTRVILTDSGGIQEEAVVFKIPTIVLRETTERPEAVEVGNSRVTGLNTSKIVKAFEDFLLEPNESNAMPFGYGDAAISILDFFEQQILGTMNSPSWYRPPKGITS